MNRVTSFIYICWTADAGQFTHLDTETERSRDCFGWRKERRKQDGGRKRGRKYAKK